MAAGEVMVHGVGIHQIGQSLWVAMMRLMPAVRLRVEDNGLRTVNQLWHDSDRLDMRAQQVVGAYCPSRWLGQHSACQGP